MFEGRHLSRCFHSLCRLLFILLAGLVPIELALLVLGVVALQLLQSVVLDGELSAGFEDEAELHGLDGVLAVPLEFGIVASGDVDEPHIVVTLVRLNHLCYD